MKRIVGISIVLITASLLLSACGVTRRIPDGEYLLAKNIIEVDKSCPKSERISADEIEEYIHQKPNKRIFGINFSMWLYSLADPNKSDGWNNFLRRVGEEPVYFNYNKAISSANNIRTYMFSRGFFNAVEEFSVDTLHKRKRIIVTYKGKQKQPYRIGNISYEFRDPLLKDVVMEEMSNTLLKTGEIYDATTLDEERTRIVNHLQNVGYYNFDVGSITYLSDSTAGNHTVDLPDTTTTALPDTKTTRFIALATSMFSRITTRQSRISIRQIVHDLTLFATMV